MMNAGDRIDQVMEFAICSIVAAEVENGCAALRWVLRRDPDNESALAWLHHCSEQYDVRISRPAETGRHTHSGPLAA